MSSNDISNKILEKISKVVKDPDEKKMIIDLLHHERRYSVKEKPQVIKKEFQLLINQYFPLKDTDNE